MQLSIANRQEGEMGQIINLPSSEEATDFKAARSIAIVSVLKIELADGNQGEQTCYPKTAADATLSPSFESSVFRCYGSNFSKMLLK